MPTITLYQFEECPFCEKVRQQLADLKLEYQKVNVPYDRDDPLRQELLQKSGVPTVPVIKVGETFIGDSQKIVKYLKEHF
ncbi:glutaredoxin [Candidatus Woesearchaeota archaeon CG10_big_fil_rev_8_21_14_0_10_45_16]|nr:MAG: glutaredoxin [Candidatus Woesearchaeota archaeon CG10_big_fil_rev_8_21_14_0_10_45_16]